MSKKFVRHCVGLSTAVALLVEGLSAPNSFAESVRDTTLVSGIPSIHQSCFSGEDPSFVGDATKRSLFRVSLLRYKSTSRQEVVAAGEGYPGFGPANSFHIDAAQSVAFMAAEHTSIKHGKVHTQRFPGIVTTGTTLSLYVSPVKHQKTHATTLHFCVAIDIVSSMNKYPHHLQAVTVEPMFHSEGVLRLSTQRNATVNLGHGYTLMVYDVSPHRRAPLRKHAIQKKVAKTRTSAP